MADGGRQAGGTARPRHLQLGAVALGGAIGGSLRYALLALSPGGALGQPAVVLLENVVGSFLLGALLASMLWRRPNGADLRPLLATGVLGSFTTFSNLALDVVALGSVASQAIALAYLSASILLGLVAAAGGIAVGRAVRGRAGPA